MLKRLRNLCFDERGMSFAFVGIGLMTFMAATTLAVDVGMFMTARTQAQTSADAGALAGATALVFNSWADRSASGPAVQSSISAASQNTVMAGVVSVQPSDVTFPVGPTGSNRVKVDVYRTAGRSNPVSTLLGSLLGMSTIDIAATATAEAAPAGGMTCVKPFIIPDKWTELTSPPWDMNTSVYEHYDNHGNELNPHDVYNPANGYSAADKGTVLILRAGGGNNIRPTFYFSWAMPGNTGASWYEENIVHCNTTVIERGYVATQEPGNMMGPTISGLQALLDQDPGAIWVNDATGGHYQSNMNPSPRVFPIPLYNPEEYEKGKQTGRTAELIVANWLGFFLERIQGNEAYGRIFPITGVTSTSAPTPATPLAYVIHLVQ
jgi:putative Flp pilus-assembly TadE/G-like protein